MKSDTHKPTDPSVFEVNEETLQALVEGELSREELRAVVAQCDRQPELWKQCAIAFLEEQAMQKELKAVARRLATSRSSTQAALPSAPTRIAASAAAVTPNVIAQATTQSSTEISSGGVTSATNRSSFLSFRTFDWVALAATLVVAFTIGLQAGKRGSNDPTSGPDTNNLAAQTPTTGAAHSALANTSPSPNNSRIGDAAGNTQLVDASASQMNPEDAWKLALERPSDFVPLERSLPPQLEQLRQRGVVKIDTTEGYVPVTLPNGRSAIVPVQQYEVKPARYAY